MRIPGLERESLRRLLRRDNDERRRWEFALVAVIALLALALAYFAGVYWGAPASVSSASRSSLARALAAEGGENAKLRVRADFLAQSLALSKESEAATKKILFKQQANEVALQKKLALYQGMFSQGAGTGPVNIAGLQIIPTGNPREYRFQIVLVRAKPGKHDRILGKCAMVIAGTSGGKPARLSYAEASPNGNPMKFTLRYFANLGGTLRLPVGFQPKELDISIQAGDGAIVASTYSWPLFKG